MIGREINGNETVYVNVNNNIKSTTFGGIVVYKNVQPGNHTICVSYEKDGALSYPITKICAIIYNIETSG
jgi:hypothetical protein